MSCFSRPRLLVASLSIVLSAAFSCSDASADHAGLGFLPYGFYQPYGASYSTSIRTPPYFATNPPVYYGARHARPYGLSPFAAPPMVSAGAGYQSRLRSKFMEPRVSTPAPILTNPCIHTRAARPTDRHASGVKLGAIQDNPFFDQLALVHTEIEAQSIAQVAKK